MNAVLKFDGPDERRRLDHMAQGVIGTGMDRPEGPLKVTGRADYADDARPEGLAHGFMVRATITRGRVTAVHADEARALPGVLAVIHDPRLLRNAAQGMADKAPVQGPDKVWYLGQPIACVVAETFEQARHAAHLLKVDYEAEDGAAVQLEAGLGEVDEPEGKQHAQGDFDRAFGDASVTVEETYRTAAHASAAMEPHAAVAEWEGEKLTVRAALQMLKYNRNEVADSLGIDPGNVRLLSPYVGGGFGSKLGASPEVIAAAIAAKEVGRPVSVVLHRRQVFESVTHRSETRQRIRLAADGKGVLTGVHHEALVANLPGEVFAEPVQQATHFLYGGEHRRIVHQVKRLNRPATGSVRAPGEAVGVTALEIAMDELAEAAGVDPVELRLRNIPAKDPESGKPFSSHTLAEALRAGAKLFGWADRQAPRARREGEWLIGMGMASAVRVNMMTEAKARVRITADGRAEVETDMTDIGTGTYSILTQIAAEMLGLRPEDVTTRLGDTDFPPGSGSGGSIGANSTGSAVFAACEALRARIAEKMECSDEELTLKDGEAVCGNRKRKLAEVIGGAMEAEGHLQPGDAASQVRQATFGSHWAEVAVSELTGETRIRRQLGVFAAGRILNAKTARSQCIGGMTWGAGMALTEEIQFDPRTGAMMNRDLAEYHMPVNRDIPQQQVEFLEERDDWASPLQAKGIGELSICGSAAAIVNAIRNATGVRVRDLPATPDKVLAGY